MGHSDEFNTKFIAKWREYISEVIRLPYAAEDVWVYVPDLMPLGQDVSFSHDHMDHRLMGMWIWHLPSLTHLQRGLRCVPTAKNVVEVSINSVKLWGQMTGRGRVLARFVLDEKEYTPRGLLLYDQR